MPLTSLFREKSAEIFLPGKRLKSKLPVKFPVILKRRYWLWKRGLLFSEIAKHGCQKLREKMNWK